MFKLKNQLREWYQPHDSFVVRNPLLPVNTFFNWKTEQGKDPLTSKHLLRKSLREFFLQPMASEALYIASPAMYEQLLLWLDDKIGRPDKKEKTENSLIKYMIRMSSRCTPYGLFATCTSGIMADETTIQFGSKEEVQRFGRLDMDYLCELHSQLLKEELICGQLCFYPNNSLYRCGNDWRYIEYRFKKESGRSYHLTEIVHSPPLEKILSAAKSGLRPKELAAIITDHEINASEALEFIYELINNQVLVDELSPRITGEEYLSLLLRRLKTLLHTGKYADRLEKLTELFKQTRIASSSGNSFYGTIAQELPVLETGFENKSLIQVDSYRSASICSLNKKVIEEILKGIGLLQLLSGKAIPDLFADFKTEFRKRYNDEWVPLVELLDTDWGIGYGKFRNTGMENSPLVDKLPIDNGRVDPPEPKNQQTESFKWQLYEQAIAKNMTEVTIDDNTIEQLSKNEMDVSGLPDSFSAMVKINATTSGDIDDGNFSISFQSVAGPSGGNLTGRFCHLHPGIEKFTSRIVEAEEACHPDCLYAEIVHLPESRTGNILIRPVLRGYEIPYLCQSPLNNESQIPVSDLLVGLESGKIVLRSKKLSKQVIPRLTTAHNFNLTSLPIYQFLCDIQNQGTPLTEWQWGILSDRPFLPRVRYGRFILSKAKWILAKEKIKDGDNKTDEDLLSVFREIKKENKLPDYVQLMQGDNELLLHLQNIYCIRLLLAELNKSGSVVLTEVTDTPEQCWIKSPDGVHAGEFIVAFSRKKQGADASLITSSAEKQNKDIKRVFPVSTEWLYAKIYCGTNTAEKLLCDVLKPLTEDLLAQKIIHKFFFIRFSDEAHHIRIRFHNPVSRNFWKEVIHRLQNALQPYIDNRMINNLQFETYQRELERYGFDTMELSEELFGFQSQAVLNFISLLDGDEGEQLRWQVGLKAIDGLLDDFSYSLEQKRDLIKVVDKSFTEEFNIGHVERKQISEQFNTHKQLVNSLMSDDWQKNESLARAITAFAFPGINYQRTVERIVKAPSVKGNKMQLNHLVQSYLHMFINRLFVSNHRKTELVMYEYLLKYYDSKIAREKMTSAPSIL